MRKFFARFRRYAIPSPHRIPATAVILLTVGLMTISAAVFAENQQPDKGSQAAVQPIEITANKLISNAKEKYAEFSGSVKAKQGNFEMTADNLRIYYEGDLVSQKKQSSDKEMIKKLVAIGNVTIVTDQYTAKSDQMEYDVATMVIVLSGKKATVTSGQNSITGSKITLYRADGRINVEGSVNALFYSEGKKSDLFGAGGSKDDSNQ